ncbi:hypothetical protein BCF33_0766 [Hasllibacter halocynthiae]|uniref:Uncharacterized protein n=1 Tax=Hasllibacter halocynthiae TaxID=595589 RepID=A0A2T0X875_9RHOB|nr:hypothetical protein [Hasllibacter halocynthiae]PRY95152.1 hypothetical protein BCF33_0766 [Hasllibacter halocynthiae]
MKWSQVKADWPAFIDAVIDQWPQADREELEDLEGDRAEVRAYLMEATGEDKATVEEEIREWLESDVPLDAIMDESKDNEMIGESGRYIPEGEDVYDDDREFGDDNQPAPPIGRT